MFGLFTGMDRYQIAFAIISLVLALVGCVVAAVASNCHQPTGILFGGLIAVGGLVGFDRAFGS